MRSGWSFCFATKKQAFLEHSHGLVMLTFEIAALTLKGRKKAAV